MSLYYNKVELCGVDTSRLPVLTEAEKRQLLRAAHEATTTHGRP